MTTRDLKALAYLVSVGGVLFAAALAAKGHVHLGAFWRQHGDAAVFGGVLFAAFLVLLLVFARVSRKRLERARAQRDRARDALFITKTSEQHIDPYRPCPTYGVPEQQLRDEFNEIVLRTFTTGGGDR